MRKYYPWFNGFLLGVLLIPVTLLYEVIQVRTIRGAFNVVLFVCFFPLTVPLILISFLKAEYLLFGEVRVKPFEARAKDAARVGMLYCGEQVCVNEDGTPCFVSTVALR